MRHRNIYSRINTVIGIRPSNLLRMFAFFSLIALFVMLSMIGLAIRNIYITHSIKDAEHTAKNIGRAFFEQKKHILFTQDSERKRWLNVAPAHFPELDEYIHKYIGALDVVKIKVFSTNEKIIYSTDHSIIGQTDMNNKALKRALKGEVISKFIKKNKTWDLAGEQKFDLDLAVTYLPMRNDINEIVGSIEIYLDTARAKTEIKAVLKSALLLFSITMILSFGILFVLMRKGIYQMERNAEMLKESEERFRNICNHAQDAVIMMDSNGKISFWNKAAQKMFQHSAAAGKDLHALIAPRKCHESYEKGFDQFKEKGEGPILEKIIELLALKKDGKEFPIELSVSRININGKWNAIGIVRDISERKRTDEEKRNWRPCFTKLKKWKPLGRWQAALHMISTISFQRLSVIPNLQTSIFPKTTKQFAI